MGSSTRPNESGPQPPQSALPSREFADRVEGILFEFFEAAQEVPAENRFLVYGLILQFNDLVSFALDPNAIRDLRKRSDAIAYWAEEFRNAVGLYLDPTYVVASYWSPLDNRRHTVVVRRTISDSAKARWALGCAYAFYALTFSGARRDSAFLSLVHFTATAKHIRRAATNTYFDSEDDSPFPGDLHIHPVVCRELLQELGWKDHLTSVILKNGRYTKELHSLLNALLKNTEDQLPENILNVDGFAEQVLSEFKERALSLPDRLSTRIERVRSQLNNCFYPNTSSTNKLDFPKACFMVATQLLWREACPCKVMYAFPTSVHNNCCIVTMGYERVISDELYLVCRSIARSALLPPLLQDYEMARIQRGLLEQFRQYAEGLVHEVAGHIGSIRRYVDMYEDQSDRLELMTQVLHPIRRLAGRCRLKLRLVLQKAGNPDVSMRNVVLEPVLAQVIGNYEDRETKYISIEAEDDLPFVRADKLQMELIFDELISNALRYAGKEARITISIRQTEDKRADNSRKVQGILCEIADTGPGIRPENKMRIFRSGVSLDPKRSGTGLAWIRSILEAHYAGEIWEDGEFGTGARFRFFLPLGTGDRSFSAGGAQVD